MRITVIALLAAIAPAVPLLGQSSPAPQETKKAAASETAFTKEERARAIAYLTETQKEFAAAVAGLSEAQWKFKAAPERWSIEETAEHIAVTEDLIWESVGKFMKSPAEPQKRAAVQGKEEMIMKAIPDRSQKATAPEQLTPTGRWQSGAEIAKHFDATRGKEIAYLTETKEDLRNHFGEHPFLKTLDVWQWLIFNGAHGKRHTAQILEVKADPKFPKS